MNQNEKLDKLLEIVVRHDEMLINMSKDLGEVKIQTIKTNGRVNKLETTDAIAQAQKANGRSMVAVWLSIGSMLVGLIGIILKYKQ